MGAATGKELDIFVEDEVARMLLLSALPSIIRSRVTVKVIGSASALSRQLAALYVRGEERPTLAIFDGDQRGKEASNLAHAQKMAEKTENDFDDWFRARIAYLPGDTWPETWIIQKSAEITGSLPALTGTDTNSLTDILEYGLQAGKHHEFFEMSKHLGLDRSQCLQLFTIHVCQHFGNEFNAVSARIDDILKS